MKKSKILTALLAIATMAGMLLVSSCDSNNQRIENIPKGPVNITIDLNLPSYQHLWGPGTYAYLEGGVNGVILTHDFDGTWYAFERTCAFEPLGNCAQIWGDSIEMNLRCGKWNNNEFSSCCGSAFMLNGFPIKGKARSRLAPYFVSQSANIVQIVN
jgi:hypothetical protein